MPKILLKVTYRVAVHEVAPFEALLMGEVLPIARQLGIDCQGVWKTVVGPVGEYLELWAFDSMADFERRWPSLLHHPRVVEIFQTTGPLVRDETFSLIEPVRADEGAASLSAR